MGDPTVNVAQASSNLRSSEKCRVLIFFNEPDKSLAGKLARKNEKDIMQKAFEDLGFGVFILGQWSQSQLSDNISSQRPSMTRCEQLVVVIMSHGTEGYIRDVNGQSIKMATILEDIGSLGPSIKKAVILQCCRGVCYLDTEGNVHSVYGGSGTAPSNTDALRDLNGEVDATNRGQPKISWKRALKKNPKCRNMLVLSSTLAQMVSVREFCLTTLKGVFDEIVQGVNPEKAQQGYDWFGDIFVKLCDRMKRETAYIDYERGGKTPTAALQIPVIVTNMGQVWRIRKASDAGQDETATDEEPDTFAKLEQIEAQLHG